MKLKQLPKILIYPVVAFVLADCVKAKRKKEQSFPLLNKLIVIGVSVTIALILFLSLTGVIRTAMP